MASSNAPAADPREEIARHLRALRTREKWLAKQERAHTSNTYWIAERKALRWALSQLDDKWQP